MLCADKTWNGDQLRDNIHKDGDIPLNDQLRYATREWNLKYKTVFEKTCNGKHDSLCYVVVDWMGLLSPGELLE